MNNNYNYILTPSQLTIVGKGKYIQINSCDTDFDEIIELLKVHDFEKIIEKVDPKSYIKTALSKDLYILNDDIYYKGKIIHNTICQRIIDFMNKGFDVKYLVNFLDNLLENPSKETVNDLYDFLEKGNLPITEDGCFIAYKYVNKNYKDRYSNTFCNEIGSICKMKREDVDPNRYNVCSAGLHACSLQYLSQANKGDHIMILKINPKNVVSIPVDYSQQKLRCCEYEVIDEFIDTNKNDLDLDKQYCDEPLLFFKEAICVSYFNDNIRKGTKILYAKVNDDEIIVKRCKGSKSYRLSINEFSLFFA